MTQLSTGSAPGGQRRNNGIGNVGLTGTTGSLVSPGLVAAPPAVSDTEKTLAALDKLLGQTGNAFGAAGNAAERVNSEFKDAIDKQIKQALQDGLLDKPNPGYTDPEVIAAHDRGLATKNAMLDAGSLQEDIDTGRIKMLPGETVADAVTRVVTGNTAGLSDEYRLAYERAFTPSAINTVQGVLHRTREVANKEALDLQMSHIAAAQNPADMMRARADVLTIAKKLNIPEREALERTFGRLMRAAANNGEVDKINAMEAQVKSLLPDLWTDARNDAQRVRDNIDAFNQKEQDRKRKQNIELMIGESTAAVIDKPTTDVREVAQNIARLGEPEKARALVEFQRESLKRDQEVKDDTAAVTTAYARMYTDPKFDQTQILQMYTDDKIGTDTLRRMVGDLNDIRDRRLNDRRLNDHRIKAAADTVEKTILGGMEFKEEQAVAAGKALHDFWRAAYDWTARNPNGSQVDFDTYMDDVASKLLTRHRPGLVQPEHVIAPTGEAARVDVGKITKPDFPTKTALNDAIKQYQLTGDGPLLTQKRKRGLDESQMQDYIDQQDQLIAPDATPEVGKLQRLKNWMESQFGGTK